MSSVNLETILEHHGVKGMKWGVRKRRNESARAKTFGNKGKSKGPDVKEIPDKELRDIVNRMNLERQFSSLTKTPSTLEKTTKTVGSILAVGATVNSAIAFSRSPAGQAIKKALVKK